MAVPAVKAATARSAYEEGLLEARRAAFALNKAAEERLLLSFSDAISRLSADATRGVITAERAASMKRQFVALMSKFEAEFVQISGTSQVVTLKRILSIHQEVLNELMGKAGLVSHSLDVVRPEITAALLARRGAQSFRSLYKYHLNAQTYKQVDTFLASAVSRGVAPARAAKDLAAIMAADNPVLRRAIQAKEAGGGKLTKAVIAEYGLKEQDISNVKTLFSDARRITVSENLNTLRETNTRALLESPVVLAATWQRSGRHGGTSSAPDECDVLATIDAYGYGPGVWVLESFPTAPHPHCGCTHGAVVTRPVNEWGTPKPAPRPRRVAPDKFEMKSDWREKWTPLRERRARETVKRATDVGITRPVTIDTAKRKPPVPKPKPISEPVPLPVRTPVANLGVSNATPESDPTHIAALIRDKAAQIMADVRAAGVSGHPKRAAAMAEAINNTMPGREVKGKFLYEQMEAGIAAFAKWNDTIYYGAHVSRALATMDLEAPVLREWTSEEITALRTAIHERFHISSPMRLDPGGRFAAIQHYIEEAGRFMEEGMVELKARKTTAKVLLGPEGNWFAQPGWFGSYGDEVTAMRVFERDFGEEALEHVWKGTTYKERLGRFAGPVRQQMKVKIRQSTAYLHLQQLYKTEFGELVEGLDAAPDDWLVRNTTQLLNAPQQLTDELRTFGRARQQGIL